MHACLADSFPPLAQRSHKGAVSTFNPTLDCAPGTHHCWVDRGSVDSKLTQGFAHMTGIVGIKPHTFGSQVQCFNSLAMRSTRIILVFIVSHSYKANTVIQCLLRYHFNSLANSKFILYTATVSLYPIL